MTKRGKWCILRLLQKNQENFSIITVGGKMRSFINQKEKELYTGFVKFTFHNSKLVKLEESSTCDVDVLRLRSLSELSFIFTIDDKKNYYGVIILEFCCGQIIGYYFSQKTILHSQGIEEYSDVEEGENANM